MLKVNPIQPIAAPKNNLKHSSKDNFQNILETKEIDIDHDQVYDTKTNKIICDLDNLGDNKEALNKLLEE